MGTKAASTF